MKRHWNSLKTSWVKLLSLNFFTVILFSGLTNIILAQAACSLSIVNYDNNSNTAYFRPYFKEQGLKTDLSVRVTGVTNLDPKAYEIKFGSQTGSDEDYRMYHDVSKWFVTNNLGTAIKEGTSDAASYSIKAGGGQLVARIPGEIFTELDTYSFYLYEGGTLLCQGDFKPGVDPADNFVQAICADLSGFYNNNIYYDRADCENNSGSWYVTSPSNYCLADPFKPDQKKDLPAYCHPDTQDASRVFPSGWNKDQIESYCIKCATKEDSGITDPTLTPMEYGAKCATEEDKQRCKLIDPNKYECRKKVNETTEDLYCLYKANIVEPPEDNRCIPGSDECKTYSGFLNEYLTCVANTVGDTSVGSCQPTEGCDKNEVCITALDDTSAKCDMKIGKCAHGELYSSIGLSADEIKNKSNPIVPVPPSRMIEKCLGDDSCTKCVARTTKSTFSRLNLTNAEIYSKLQSLRSDPANFTEFASFQEAAAVEYGYNQAVDTWKDLDKVNRPYVPPQPEEYGISYTGLIYTSLGCIDTTDNGLLTRIVQIALGIIGTIILVRFGQAAMKLQGGGSPEDRAEGVEIVSSAIVALLLFTMSLIGLRFIGVNVLQIFSPGTVEFAPPQGAGNEEEGTIAQTGK